MINQKDFKIRKPGIIGEEKFRQYAVLAPLIETDKGLSFLFEKRSQKLNRQPGEICFPGGKLEKGESLEECAIRETTEEILVESHQIEITGPGDIFVSPFNIMIQPFLGRIQDYKDSYSLDEVERVIKVPLEFFRNNKPEGYKNKIINQPPEDFPYEWIPGGENYPWVNGTYDILFYKYEDEIIWGLTARIVQSIVELIDEYHLI